jgi:hypothetical protein
MFLVACGRQSTSQELSGDAKLRHKIVGTWLATNGVITYLPDGHSSARFTNGALELDFETMWDVSKPSLSGGVEFPSVAFMLNEYDDRRKINKGFHHLAEPPI